jgi:hypothetical protein
MCALLACDLGDVVLRSVELLRELCLDRGWTTTGDVVLRSVELLRELCLDRGWTTTVCNSSLNFAFTW